jgi:hypothetical protein
MLRKTVLALALLCTATALSACYVAAGPGYGRCGGRGWIPAHTGPYGGYVPGHCA